MNIFCVTEFRRGGKTRLKWGDIRREKLLLRGKLPVELGTQFGNRQARPHTGPAFGIRHVTPQPRGVTVEAVLAEAPAGDGVGAVGARDGEGDEEEDEEGHGEEVDGQEAGAVAVGADEADEGEEEEEAAEKHHRPPEEVDALVVGLGGQPDPGGYHGDGT